MPVKPIVLIVGDSISIGYTPFVADALAGEARVVHHEGNGGDSGNVVAKLDEWRRRIVALIAFHGTGFADGAT